MKADGEDKKIASDLTTDEHGRWTSVGSEAQYKLPGQEPVAFSVGLPAGEYYFKETATGEDFILET